MLERESIERVESDAARESHPLHPLHTIGHSNLAIEGFAVRLRLHAIDAVADVRSSPYSRRDS